MLAEIPAVQPDVRNRAHRIELQKVTAGGCGMRRFEVKAIPAHSLYIVRERRALGAVVADAVPSVRQLDRSPACIVKGLRFDAAQIRRLRETPSCIQRRDQTRLLCGSNRREERYHAQRIARPMTGHSFPLFAAYQFVIVPSSSRFTGR